MDELGVSAIIAIDWRQPVILCDLCGQTKECQPKDIEGKEYDICSDCWNPLAEKLKGKGRTKKERETVFLPPVIPEPKREEPKIAPGEPPKIWGMGRPQ
jgi:ribosome-binding protein aMBF1 (putative translation factor)